VRLGQRASQRPSRSPGRAPAGPDPDSSGRRRGRTGDPAAGEQVVVPRLLQTCTSCQLRSSRSVGSAPVRATHQAPPASSDQVGRSGQPQFVLRIRHLLPAQIKSVGRVSPSSCYASGTSCQLRSSRSVGRSGGRVGCGACRRAHDGVGTRGSVNGHEDLPAARAFSTPCMCSVTLYVQCHFERLTFSHKIVAGLAAGPGSGPSTSTPQRWKSGMTQIQKPAFGGRVLGRGQELDPSIAVSAKRQRRGSAVPQEPQVCTCAKGPVTRSVRSDTLVACRLAAGGRGRQLC